MSMGDSVKDTHWVYLPFLQMRILRPRKPGRTDSGHATCLQVLLIPLVLKVMGVGVQRPGLWEHLGGSLWTSESTLRWGTPKGQVLHCYFMFPKARGANVAERRWP